MQIYQLENLLSTIFIIFDINSRFWNEILFITFFNLIEPFKMPFRIHCNFLQYELWSWNVIFYFYEKKKTTWTSISFVCAQFRFLSPTQIKKWHLLLTPSQCTTRERPRTECHLNVICIVVTIHFIYVLSIIKILSMIKSHPF